MNNYVLRGLFFFSFVLLFASCGIESKEQVVSSNEAMEEPGGKKWQSIKDALDYDEMITKDPALGYAPTERLIKATKIARERQNEQAKLRSSSGQQGTLDEAKWVSRGPNNIGGRTRAIHIDLRDPERKKLWVGSVSGGLWVTEDITVDNPEWKIVNDYWQNMSVGAIAQHPNDQNVMYVGTGEGYSSVSSVRGNGIFKSINGGESWEHLQATVNNFNFESTQDIIVRPNGDVYAGTTRGIRRSLDGGQTWERVLAQGVGASSNRVNDLILIDDGTMFASTNTSIHRSTDGGIGTWTNISTNTPGFPGTTTRIEIDVCKNDIATIYALCANGTVASDVVSSVDGGLNWLPRTLPTFPNGNGVFTRDQAWYNLDIAVDPHNCDMILAGGVTLVQSAFRAISWQTVGGLHVDQHVEQYDQVLPGVSYFGNDGGIYRRTGGQGGNMESKNRGYITTQFYACALHPEANSNFMLGGTQDNSSLQLDSEGIGPALNVRGGDGAYCFIDQNEPNIQIVSSQNGNYEATTNGDLTNENRFADVNGGFINRSDYDDDANLLYGQTNESDFFRWDLENSNLQFIDITNQATGNATAFLADPNVDNKLWVGSGSRLIVIDNAHQGDFVSGQFIENFAGNGNISCIYIDKSNPNDILITLSNYGLNNNVFVSRDGGQSFIGIEGDLPDIPVRWGIFNPMDHSQIVLATELGIWTTEKEEGSNTQWIPSTSSPSGAPFVRTDMLQIRDSDNVLLSATHGRGLYTTGHFTVKNADFTFFPIGYVGEEVSFNAGLSVLAEKFDWLLGDGNSSSGEVISHIFEEPGDYEVTLFIDENTFATKSISILPKLELPYTSSVQDYNGNFENSSIDFADYTLTGSQFSRGNSSVTGKNGTSSGDNAYVLGINEDEYQNNTVAYLYTPAFDFSDLTLYQLSFMSRYLIHNRFDGFRIQYLTDLDGNWRQLGSAEDNGWYNYDNQNLDDAAFPVGSQYFTGTQAGFEEFDLDVSFLAGEPFVAFRVEFRSEGTGFGVGVAIDDFEISKFDGAVETTIFNQTAGYINDNEVMISWRTEPEFQAIRFELERSYDGINYDKIETIAATGRTTQVPQEYNVIESDIRPTIFYRLLSINENPSLDYSFNFYSPIMVAKRNPNETPAVFNIFPNPFTDNISVTFNDIIGQEVTARLFDMNGRLLGETITAPNDVFLQFSDLNVTSGIYLLSIQIGEDEPKTFKLFGSQG